MKSRIIASIIFIIAAIALLNDKIFTNVKFEENHGCGDSLILLWLLSQIISPLIMFFMVPFKPFRIAYLFPIYIYSIELYWVLSSRDANPHHNDRDYFNIYATGIVILFIIALFVFDRYIKKEKELAEQVSLLQRVLDLSIKINE